METFYTQAANTLGANKAMVALMNSGKASADGRELFEEGIAYGEQVVARGIANGEISRLEAMQAEGRGAKSVRAFYNR